MSKRTKEQQKPPEPPRPPAPPKKEEPVAERTKERANARDGEGVLGADGEGIGAPAGPAEAPAAAGPAVEDRVPAVEPAPTPEKLRTPPPAWGVGIRTTPSGEIDDSHPSDGDGPTDEEVAAWEEGEDLSDLPEPLQKAIVAFGLKRDWVLGHRVTDEGGCVVVTRGGRKLNWPGDEAKAAALPPQDKDGIRRGDFPAANLMGKRN